MTWFYIALIAPALWSVCNHIDKYLISKYFQGGGIGSLVIFSSFIGFLLFPFIFLLHPTVLTIPPFFAFLIIINGFLYVLSLIPYMYALGKDEASTVVPLFQLIPVISYILGIIVLKETLTPFQLLASLLVISGGIILALDTSGTKLKFKSSVFGLILFASFFISLNGLIFKVVAINTDFWTTSFWEYIGFSICGLLLFLGVPSYRNQFLQVIKVNRLSILSLNTINEIINITAKISMNIATILAPFALAWVVNGFQPFFVFVYGVILTLFFPHLGSESLLKKHLIQKIGAITLMFLGTYLLNSK